MAALSLEERVAALEAQIARLAELEAQAQRLTELEAQVAQLTAERPNANATPAPWWELHAGAFKDDPVFDEAMRLGAEYRRSQPTSDDDDVSA